MLAGIKERIRNYIGEGNFNYLKDFSSFGLWYFISAAVALVTTVIINSTMVPEELGKFSYNKSIIELCSTALSLTIYQSYLRFNIKGESIVLRKVVYWLTFVGVVVLSIIISFLTKSFWAIPFALLMVYNERYYLTRSMMDVRSVNQIGFLSVTITLGVIGALYLSGICIKSEYVFLAYGFGYAYSVRYYFKKYPENDDRGSLHLKTILKFSLPGFAIVVVNWLINLYGQVLIKELYGYTDVAKIAIAQRTITVIGLFSGLLLTFYPMIYYRIIDQKDGKSLVMLRVFMSSIMIIVGVFSFCFSGLLYRILGASQYIEYVDYFKILVISEVIRTIATFYSTYLGFALKTYISLIICAVGAIVNIVLLHVFLQSYVIGIAAVSILVSNIIMAVLIFLTAYRMERKYLNA